MLPADRAEIARTKSITQLRALRQYHQERAGREPFGEEHAAAAEAIDAKLGTLQSRFQRDGMLITYEGKIGSAKVTQNHKFEVVHPDGHITHEYVSAREHQSISDAKQAVLDKVGLNPTAVKAARAQDAISHETPQQRRDREDADRRLTQPPKAPEESIHERSARLQREGNLPREVRPGEELRVVDGPELGHFAPYAEKDAGALLRAYGEHQLGLALSSARMGNVRMMARKAGVSEPLPRSKADLVSRITAHLTGGRYSADFGASGARSAAAARGAGGGDRRAANYEARIARKEADLAALRKEYEDYRKSKGLSDGEHDDHTLRLLERMDTTRATLRRMRDEYTGRTGRRI